MTSKNNKNYLNSEIIDNNKNRDVIPSRNLEESEGILPYCLTYLTPALIKEAEIHLHETEENKARCLREFKNFIKNQKNLFTPTDDLFLLAFLRARKYDLERTYKLFLNFWKFRKDYHVYFENINVEAVLAVLYRNIVGYLEHRDKDGASVFVFRVGQWNPQVDSYESLFLAVTAMLKLSLEYDANQISGMRIILDFRGFSWAQMKYCTPSTIALVVNSTQFCLPTRFKGVHVITHNKFFRVLFTIAYPMLTQKIKNRVFLHSVDLKPIQKYIHPSVLPVDFGGDSPAFETTKWKNYYNERIEKFMKMSRHGYTDQYNS